MVVESRFHHLWLYRSTESYLARDLMLIFFLFFLLKMYRTTIIEALKYAITGSFPPGCGRSGNAFVHDPKAIVQTTVKANVKLRFTSRSGQSMVVVRSMELSQKKTTQTFKQLDGVLRMMDPETGERVSLSHKCTELDKQIPQLLGVSKPILEHVVFCHQEDSSWPLMEGAVLKKRFDDIFDSTKYSKALHIFRQTEKDFLSKVKDLKIEVASFSAHKQAADAFMKELQEQNEQVESLDDMKKELSQEISALDARMKSLQDIVSAVERIDDLIETRKNEITQKMQVSNKQREMLEEDLTQRHAIEELKGMLDDFYRKMVVQVDEKRELEQNVNHLQEEIENARQEEITLTNRIGKLTAEKDVYEKNTVGRFTKMERIAQTYILNFSQLTMSQGNTSFASTYLSQTQGEVTSDYDVGTMVSISAEDMQRFFLKLEEKKAELVASIYDHRTKYRSEEDNITAVLTELGGKLQAIDNGE
jgi:DNA repair protein RAD50